MKTILLAGCCGEMGKVLYKSLKHDYSLIPCDVLVPPKGFDNYRRIDFCDYEQVARLFSQESIDAVISLIGIAEAPAIPDPLLFSKMSQTYLSSTFYLLSSMARNGVKKFVLASSNHVTDYYEEDGWSKIGREIHTGDYPRSKSVYGTLKLGAESLCHNFYCNCGIQSVSFRIGTYRETIDWNKMPDRWHRTVLTTADMVHYFRVAVEKQTAADIYYLVSDNNDKPWRTDDLKMDMS